MRDPDEGIGPDGAIVTGVDRDRVPARFEPVLTAAAAALADCPDASLYVYGSVATGRARDPTSDVDLVVIGVPAEEAARNAEELSRRFADRCRAVELSAVPHDALVAGSDEAGDSVDGERADGDRADSDEAYGDSVDGDRADGDRADSDEAYGDRVFLRHYCAHVAGPDPARGLPAFPADRRAARGFNGDIGLHADRWRAALGTTDPSAESRTALGRRLARKTLFAVAGLVSVHDATWTTDRSSSAARWAEIDPPVAAGLRMLVGWSEGGESGRGDGAPTVAGLERALDTTVAHIVERFAAEIGSWDR